MYRYVALVWNPSKAGQNDTAERLAQQLKHPGSIWTTAYSGSGISVFHAGESPGRMQAYSLESGAGVILGKLFHRDDDENDRPIESTIAHPDAQRITLSRGRDLVTRYWGRYVAFLRDKSARTALIVRDPIGGFPCFHSHYQGVEIFFSCTQDIANLPLRLDVDWHYMAEFLAFGMMNRHETGLKNVTMLLPGECMAVTPDGRSSQYLWNPVEFAEDCIESPNQARELLHSTISRSVSVWAKGYQHILHRLSGGLDSSIVLACLTSMNRPPLLHCITAYTETADGDERSYARMAAAQAKVPLVEYEQRIADVDMARILQMPRTPVPDFPLLSMDRCKFEQRLALDVDAQATFSGGGGDGLFLQPRTGLGAVDFVRRHGLGRGILGVLMDAARLQRLSLWSVIRNTARDVVRRGHWNPYTDYAAADSRLVPQEVIAELDPFSVLPPWFQHAAHLPPGKQLHMFIAMTPPLYYEPLASGDSFLDPVTPFCSQPVVELCLRLPTYLLSMGGRDRGLVRAAFARQLLPQIARREAKGTTTGHFTGVFRRNIDFVRQLLLDGLLVRNGLLDRAAIERALSGDPADTRAEHVQLICHLDAEAWARHWEGQRLGLAA